MNISCAEMAELVDAQGSGPCGALVTVPVRLRFSAPVYAPTELRLAGQFFQGRFYTRQKIVESWRRLCGEAFDEAIAQAK